MTALLESLAEGNQLLHRTLGWGSPPCTECSDHESKDVSQSYVTLRNHGMDELGGTDDTARRR